MHLRSLKKARKDVSLHDPIGTDKEGNELPLTLYIWLRVLKFRMYIKIEVIANLPFFLFIYTFI